MLTTVSLGRFAVTSSASCRRTCRPSVEDGTDVAQAFEPCSRLSWNRTSHTRAPPQHNEVYERVKGLGKSLTELAADPTDYKALITAAKDTSEKLVLAKSLGTRRLACGVIPDWTRASRPGSSKREGFGCKAMAVSRAGGRSTPLAVTWTWRPPGRELLKHQAAHDAAKKGEADQPAARAKLGTGAAENAGPVDRKLQRRHQGAPPRV